MVIDPAKHDFKEDQGLLYLPSLDAEDPLPPNISTVVPTQPQLPPQLQYGTPFPQQL